MSEIPSKSVLHQVEEILRERQQEDSEQSYSAKLMRAGSPAIKRKIGEEAIEVVLTPDDKKAEMTSEVADLWFHCLVLMVYNGLTLDELMDEFARRMNISGLEEKRQRQQKG